MLNSSFAYKKLQGYTNHHNNILENLFGMKARENQNYNNCISLIKLLAAFQVIYGHVTNHLSLKEPWLLHQVMFYYNGVPIFFVLCGFLIWLSIDRSPNYGIYLKKRFLRIYPELWVAVVVEIISIVLLYHGWKPISLSVFALTQGTIFQFWTPESLRGYGCGTPNGSLWTICVMIQFYIIAWLIWKIMHNRKPTWWIIGLILLVAASVGGQKMITLTDKELIIKIYGQTIVRHCWLFYTGCLIAEFRDKTVPILSKYWFIFLLGGIIPYATGIDIVAKYGVLWSIMLVSGLIGFSYRFPQLAVPIDISYGLFLYHMIIVNVFITFELVGSWWYAFAVLVLSIICAYISNAVIGCWALKKKPKPECV